MNVGRPEKGRSKRALSNPVFSMQNEPQGEDTCWSKVTHLFSQIHRIHLSFPFIRKTTLWNCDYGCSKDQEA